MALEAAAFSIPTASSSSSSSNEKVSEPQTTSKGAPQCSVTCVYQAKLGQLYYIISVTWCKNLTSHALSITVENPPQENRYTCKIDLKTWQFWGKKGLKSFEIDGKRADIFWDFRQAKFTSATEPCSDYYVALVSNEEVVLLLGDLKKDAFKRARSRPSLDEATLLCKKENVYGKRSFCTRTMVGADQKEHDIAIENYLLGPGDPEMRISVDGTVAVRIMNLNWRFRGNETVMVNNVPLQIFWDVHDWLFNGPGSGQGLFIFKPGKLDGESNNSNNLDERNCSDGIITEFSHFLYAWKTE